MLLRIAGRESGFAAGVCLLLFWAPLPAGSVTPGGQLIVRLAACGLVVWALALRSGQLRLPRLLPALALAGVGLLGFVQACPWPGAVAAVVSPEHHRLALEAAELLEKPVPSFVSLSLDAALAGSAGLSWLASAALLAAAQVAGRDALDRCRLLAALIAAALVQIGWGLVRLHDAAPEGLATVLLRPEGRLRGTFANPNHLALLLEIALAATAAWSWFELSQRRRKKGRKARLRRLLPLLVWGVLLVGVVLTGSRAGLAAAVAGTLAQAMAMTLAGRSRRAAWLTVLCVALALGLIGLLAGGLEIRRYEGVSLFETNLRSRMLLTGPALDLWQRFPLTGTGLGTFEDAFPMVAPAELAPVLWNRAHNDPLELLVTGGLVGVALGLAALVALLPPIWRGLRRGEPASRAAAVAAAGALTMAGLHELFDFGLVIPANALALAVVLGAAAAAGSATTRRG